ncbi:prolipoprotein diacylglyceryl transferase [Rhodohalobacter barkolensis]|uniref:Phosphatidylglycerol--prolipoprotein diacylglyceryl transferase n=1 Tax=Rhodohalobacter barkolensis TaxID=2053187 RepID=A0A2N0VHE1_9BACT|nr:prolipoprotein diacylglyceryl transferase [Rhodohalobacter barkolensis]PKD43612.1 prolipoprotein diacylglyceryl transferase [Rhodohalobacter barkolensis]
MNNSSYITWDFDPVLVSIPEISLPVPISIWGIVIAAALIYFGWSKIKPPAQNGKDAPEPEGWKAAGLIIGAFIVGQLPFLLIDSPSISSIGPIEPRWYGLMFAMAFMSGYFVGLKMYKDAGRSQEELDRLLIYVLVATVIGARLGHVFFYEAEFYLRNIHLIPQVWVGGLASHGAAIGIIIAMYLYAKRTANTSFMWVADRVVPGVAIGGMFIRTGNFFNSEIVGVPTDLPWAIIFKASNQLSEAERLIPRHPSMLYEAILCVIVLGVLFVIYNKYKKNPPEGSLFGAFLIMLFTGRFLIEFTKETQADFLVGAAFDMGQLLSVPFVLIGIWILWKKVKW